MLAGIPTLRSRAIVATHLLILVAGLVLVAGPRAAPAQTGGKVDPKVLKAVRGGRTATYWAILGKQADLFHASSITSWDVRGAWVVDRLKRVAASTQGVMKVLLSERKASYQSFWIINAVRISSGAATLSAVAARPEVDRVEPAWTAQVPKPLPGDIETVEWNIIHINADDVWNTYNDRGEGVTVANVDTGVQFTHPALLQNYRGISTAQTGLVRHDYNWYDPSRICHPMGRVPCDNRGHGTHTMGIMVGDDRGQNQIGVAPRARWIAAKGCESSSCSDSALLKSGQFMLAPTDLNDMNPRPDLRPHVVNNSWGTPVGADEFYRATVNAWVASGIFPVFSNGGSGPGCGTVDAPASYPESTGVGAHDINNAIASFSARGPSPISPFPIKPDLAAPGVNVRSSVPPNSYAIISGTSMAAPHVAGTVALIWSPGGAPAFSRDVAETRAVLDSTAVDMSDLTCGGTPGDNNVWGEGRLDAFAAVTAARNRQLWVKRYDGPGGGIDVAYALGVSPDGSTVFAAGSSDTDVFDYEYTTVAYDASTGAERWVSRYDGPGTGSYDDGATALGVSPDGFTVFVTGRSGGATSDMDYATVAYDAATGAERWAARYNGPGNFIDEAQALGVSPDGSTVFVTGWSRGATRDYATVAYDAATGAERWVSRYDAPGEGSDEAQALEVSPDGSTVFVTGEGQWFTRDYTTVAYDAATGAERWVSRYNGPANDFDAAWALGVSPDGSTVFVTGSTEWPGGDVDYATVAYEASTGAERWSMRYNGNGPGTSYDTAWALGVSPDGSKVFVTGQSEGAMSNDFATVAYRS